MKRIFLFPVALTCLLPACGLTNSLGSNDSGFGDEVGAEIGDDPIPDPGAGLECYGLPQFDDFDGLLSEIEQNAVTEFGSLSGVTSEVACYTPKLETLGGFLNYPNPVEVPDMSEGILDWVETGVICNFSTQIEDTPLSSEAGLKLPFYTGPFIDSQGEVTLRYPACAEPCSSIGVASDIDNVKGLNEFCKQHIIRHGIDPDGNGFNDGVRVFDTDWSLGASIIASQCVSTESQGWDLNIPTFINADHLLSSIGFLFELFDLPTPQSVLEELGASINDAPWTWNFWLFVGGCEMDAVGFKKLDAQFWEWDTPCPNNYVAIMGDAHVKQLETTYGVIPAFVKEGFCYMDGETHSGIKPKPESQSILAQLGSEGSLPLDDWKSLILVQHGGGKRWPAEGLSVENLDSNTLTVQFHQGLIDMAEENPELLFDGVDTRIVPFDDGSGEEKPGLMLVTVPEGSLLDALGYQADDIIFSVRGKDGEGANWTNQFADLKGNLADEVSRFIILGMNRKSVTVMHARMMPVQVDPDFDGDMTSLPAETLEIQSRHFFRWKELPVTP